MVNEVERIVRAIKYKTGEYDLNDKVDLIELVKELKPKHEEKIRIIIKKMWIQ